ncbi:hypothetical protein [Leptospira santarosai]|uniref:Uncharacterized protein n=1 Tax=Leptospira santarosai str. ZUN179 TaxID=1049985 RepID=M6V2Q0_9LEPT|nr:hypothetical protein [Leptospira santarosai]EMO43808.1 hypothetical protein LEP1GSC187_0536 [Leptospira santarosai str. ZUN179]
MAKHKKTFWQKLADNATKGRISTALGIVLVIGAVASVFTGQADWTQASIAITAGLAAIGFVGRNGVEAHGKNDGSNSL